MILNGVVVVLYKINEEFTRGSLVEFEIDSGLSITLELTEEFIGDLGGLGEVKGGSCLRRSTGLGGDNSE